MNPARSVAYTPTRWPRWFRGRRPLSPEQRLPSGWRRARKLAGLGAELVLVARDRARGEAVVATVKGVRDRMPSR
jgi:hypothetical protein